jgi:hypothetical protein
MPRARSTKYAGMLGSLIVSARLMIAEATAAIGIPLFEVESLGGHHFPAVSSSVW